MSEAYFLYDVCRCPTVIGLQIEITQRLKEGWALAGGVSFANYEDGKFGEYLQAITRAPK